MIKLVLFDADGVVIATTERFGDYLGKKNNIPLEKMKPFYKGIFLECVKGKADVKQAIQPYLREWGYSKSAESFLDEWFRFEHKINKPMIKDIRRLQERGIRCYLATNQEKYRTQYLMKEMGFKDIFDGIFSSANIGHMKESPEFFRLVLKELSEVKPEEILFWDDHLKKLEAAQEVGIQVEQYFTYEDFREKMDFYVNNLI